MSGTNTEIQLDLDAVMMDLGTLGYVRSDSVADAYDEEGNYSVGDVVMHEGQLYRCTVAASAEEWTEAHWTETTVEDILDGKEDHIDAENVSGSTPVIVCKEGHRYVCGEVSAITITPSANGVCDVIFRSGSTPAVMTIVGTVKWPAGFNYASLWSNTYYEINILDGTYGVVGTWT